MRRLLPLSFVLAACGGAPSVPDVAEDVVLQFRIDVCLVADEEPTACMSRPRIMTLEGTVATVTSTAVMPGDAPVAERTYEQGLTVTPNRAGDRIHLAGALSWSSALGAQRWSYEVAVAPGATVELAPDAPHALATQLRVVAAEDAASLDAQGEVTYVPDAVRVELVAPE